MPPEPLQSAFYLVRSFDFGGYYETRSALALVALAVAFWRWRGGDRRFLIVFVSGFLFQTILEWQLALLSMRGPGFSIGLFGATLSGFTAQLTQGFLEGGPLALSGWWFVDLVRERRPRAHWAGYAAFLALVVILAAVVVWRSQGAPESSVRPMFVQNTLALVVVVASFALAGLRGSAGLKALCLWGAGVMIYLVWNFTPLQIGGVRVIGVAGAEGVAMARLWDQIWVMGLGLAWEVMAGKLHYVAVPLALGLLTTPKRKQTA